MSAPPEPVATQPAVPFAAAQQPAAAALRPTARHLIILAAVAAAAIVPLFAQSFVTFELTQVMVYALAILGLNLLTGFNGQFSLGHSAFYGIGAYTAAILMDKLDIPYFATLPAAGAVCFVVGFLFGFPALRLQGIYLALATFALAIAMPQILKFGPLEPLTGGVQGISILKPDPPFGLPVDADQWLYYFTLAVLLLMFALARNLTHSRSGRAIMAIRDHPIAAAAMGVNTALYKTLTFGVSALYTGIAGAIGAIVVQFVAPDSFSFLLSISLLVGLVVGGVGSIPGCLVGGLFVLFGPNIAEYVAPRLFEAVSLLTGGLVAIDVSRSRAIGLAGAIYGVIMLLVIFVMPSGAAGFLRLVGAQAGRLRRPSAHNNDTRRKQ